MADDLDKKGRFMKNQILCGAALALIGSGASAQNIDGLYQPSGASWTCSSDQIGMDGGALSIRDNIFDGVENRCQLIDRQPAGAGARFVAVCSGEGSEYREAITITPTANGVKIEREGSTVYWRRCDGQQRASGAVAEAQPPSNSRWTFGGSQGVYESATQDSHGNGIIFSCNDLGDDGRLWIELGGQPISGGPVTIDIDGQEFQMMAWSDGGNINTECRACAENYTSLWKATAAGNTMAVRASDGRSAAFSLRGSRDALGDQACLPAQ